MKRYFIITNSFAAPFFSDTDEYFVFGETPEEALLNAVKNYTHPCGLFAAVLYESADAYHSKEKPILEWLCNHEIEKQKITKNLGGYSYLGKAPGQFEIDGKEYVVENPKEGKVLSRPIQ